MFSFLTLSTLLSRYCSEIEGVSLELNRVHLHIMYVIKDPQPMVDPNGHIFAVLADMLADPAYKKSTNVLFKDMKARGAREVFKAEKSTH